MNKEERREITQGLTDFILEMKNANGYNISSVIRNRIVGKVSQLLSLQEDKAPQEGEDYPHDREVHDLNYLIGTLEKKIKELSQPSEGVTDEEIDSIAFDLSTEVLIERGCSWQMVSTFLKERLSKQNPVKQVEGVTVSDEERPKIEDCFLDMPLTEVNAEFQKSPMMFMYIKMLDNYIDKLTKQNPVKDERDSDSYCNDCGDYVGNGCDNKGCKDFNQH